MSKSGCRRNCRRGFTFVDLLVVILIVCFLSAVAFSGGGLSRAHETANRVRCASNLKQVGLAIQLYSNENKGNYPRTIYKPDDALAQFTGVDCKDPFGKDGPPKPNDITAAIWLLVRTQDITTDVFVCPSTNATKMKYPDQKTAADFGNFKSVDNLSYSMANMYPDKKVVEKGYKMNATTGAEIAIMADVTSKTGPADERAAATKMQKANSMNHWGRGQNVLFGDGHVEFETNAFCGQKHDNIFTVSGSDDGSKTTSETISGSPMWAGDSVLLPAATDSPRKENPTREELLAEHEDLVQEMSLDRIALGLEQLHNGKTDEYRELSQEITEMEKEIADNEAQLKKLGATIPAKESPKPSPAAK
jgi:prepilin-type processing-associated H-X9-DG protein